MPSCPRAWSGVLLALLLLSGCAAGTGERPAAAPPAAGETGARWAPEPGTAWQWQLTGPLDLSVDVPVYEVDGERTSEAQVAALHARGRRAICYVSVGSWEDFRPDARDFPDAVLGERLDGFPDERWLDVRRTDLLAPLLAARLDDCRAKGFDAVEADNVDGFANDTGFPLTAPDQLVFNRWVAEQVHERGMGVALKNDLDQVPDLARDFDFAVVEQCARFDECDRLQPFVDAGKAVLRVEYGATAAACGPPWPGAPVMVKRERLDAFRLLCSG